MKLLSLDRLTDDGGWRLSETRQAVLAGPVAALGSEAWHVELAWVDDTEMRTLNARYRDQDKVTDVLSFSNLVATGTGEPALSGGVGGAPADIWWDLGEDPDAGAAGEIVIAPRYVECCCRENGRDFDDELALLVVHGVLHVLGWDHATEAETRAMRLTERDALAVCGLRHPMFKG